MLLALRGRRETASVTDPVDCSCGTFAADSARCIAAADGCVAIGVVKVVGLLSLRCGEVLREVCGLEPADGEALVGRRLLDRCFRRGGAVAAVGVEDADICLCPGSFFFEAELSSAPVAFSACALLPLPAF